MIRGLISICDRAAFSKIHGVGIRQWDKVIKKNNIKIE
jgi:hypothetical protein